MNLIPCSEKCTHQREGYCNCDEAGTVSQNATAQKNGCLYFLPEEKPPPPLAQEAQRFR